MNKNLASLALYCLITFITPYQATSQYVHQSKKITTVTHNRNSCGIHADMWCSAGNIGTVSYLGWCENWGYSSWGDAVIYANDKARQYGIPTGSGPNSGSPSSGTGQAHSPGFTGSCRVVTLNGGMAWYEYVFETGGSVGDVGGSVVHNVKINIAIGMREMQWGF